jgi:hypothetical protein
MRLHGGFEDFAGKHETDHRHLIVFRCIRDEILKHIASVATETHWLARRRTVWA